MTMSGNDIATYYACQPIDSIPCVYGPSFDKPWYELSPVNRPLLPPGTRTFSIDLGAPTMIDPEFAALSRCITELSKLDDPARKRVVRYLVERFGG